MTMVDIRKDLYEKAKRYHESHYPEYPSIRSVVLKSMEAFLERYEDGLNQES